MQRHARRFSFLFLLLIPIFATAETLQDRFEQLKDSGEKYQIIGTICEQVARLEMTKEYPESQYEVTTGIQYGDKNRTIGELDVIVFSKQDHKAVMVAEVKCWKDMSAGLNKARDQRQRFLNSLNSKANLIFEKDGQRYSPKQFEGLTTFISIAQSGSRKAGYDRDLEFTLDELMDLRQQLMQCQKSGKCRKSN